MKTEGCNRCRHIKVSIHIRCRQRVVLWHPTEGGWGKFNVVLLCRRKLLLWHILPNVSMMDGGHNI